MILGNSHFLQIIVGSCNGLVPTRQHTDSSIIHDDVIKWKHFPRDMPFVRGIHRSPVNSPHKGQWREALMFSLSCSWTNGSVNNWGAGDLRSHRAHPDVTVMRLDAITRPRMLIWYPWHPYAFVATRVINRHSTLLYWILHWVQMPIVIWHVCNESSAILTSHKV